jgi:hypothetical protein
MITRHGNNGLRAAALQTINAASKTRPEQGTRGD